MHDEVCRRIQIDVSRLGNAVFGHAGASDQVAHNGSAAQKYTIKENGDGTFTFINKKSGKALDVAGGKMGNKANVQQYKSNGTAAQKWKLIKMSDYAVSNYPIKESGTYSINSR